MALLVNQNIYYGKYAGYSTDFESYLFADSHGDALKKLLEPYGIYNFSYASDSYNDMYRKIKFIAGKTSVKTVYISADEHMLSPYRETTNNKTGSLFYASWDEFGNRYDYIKERYVKRYAVLFQPRIRDLTRARLYSGAMKIFRRIVSGDVTAGVTAAAGLSWAERSANERIQMAQSRAAEQFPSRAPSDKLEQTLAQIITFCRQNNIELIGIKFPLADEFRAVTAGREYGVKKLFSANGITILDFETAFSGKPEYFQDQDHLNEQGAEEFVKLFVKKFYRSPVSP
jgi:hypothetical protein